MELTVEQTTEKAMTATSSSSAPSPRRQHVRVLGGLPRPVLAGILAVAIAAVGVGGLCRAGVLAPQFKNAGGGVGQGSFPRGAVHVGWTVLRNVSWRSWTITSLDVPDKPGRDIVAFVKPAAASTPLPDQLMTSAADPTLTRLPLVVAPGREVVVLELQRPGACARPDLPAGAPTETRASVGIASPLGHRRIPATLFVGAPAPGSTAACESAP